MQTVGREKWGPRQSRGEQLPKAPARILRQITIVIPVMGLVTRNTPMQASACHAVNHRDRLLEAAPTACSP